MRLAARAWRRRSRGGRGRREAPPPRVQRGWRRRPEPPRPTCPGPRRRPRASSGDEREEAKRSRSGPARTRAWRSPRTSRRPNRAVPACTRAADCADRRPSLASSRATPRAASTTTRARAMALPPSARPSAPRAWGIVATCARDPRGLGRSRSRTPRLQRGPGSTMAGASAAMALPSRRGLAREPRGMPVQQAER